jgi:predicted ATP-dependent serine protease
MTINVQGLNTIEVPDWMQETIPSGIKVMDEFINGEGLHPGQVVTVSASRGTGKTTLLLQLLNGIAKNNPHLSIVYVSFEEPSFQLKKTASRIGVDQNIGIIGDETDVTLEEFGSLFKTYNLIVLDSFSLLKGESDGPKMKMLKDTAKENKCTFIVVLHQTKDGSSKGSSDIEHLVDTVIDIERGEGNTRILKMDKNRFGSIGEVSLNLERNGWDFDNPVEAKEMNVENRNSSQAKKPKELKDIMDLNQKFTRFTFGDLNSFIPTDDSAAVGRFERHLKELEKNGKLIKIGRGAQACWEFACK